MDPRKTDKIRHSRIAGVVVLYQPEDSVVDNVATYIRDLEILFVFDNSPDESKRVVQRILRFDNTRYITKGSNVGIATAFNIAAGVAQQEGFDYLLTMDQDSAAYENMIPTMVSAIGHCRSIGLITPFHVDRNAPMTPPNIEKEKVVVAMASGNLLNLEAYARCGSFLDKLFIDSIDTEYCLRLQTLGYDVVRVNTALLSHAMGKFTCRTFLWRKVYPSNYSPIRHYYQTRNRFHIRRLYREKFPDYFAKDLKLFWATLVKVLLYEQERWRKLRMILKGYLAYHRDDFSERFL